MQLARQSAAKRPRFSLALPLPSVREQDTAEVLQRGSQ